MTSSPSAPLTSGCREEFGFVASCSAESLLTFFGGIYCDCSGGVCCLRPGGVLPVCASAVWAPRETTALAVTSGSLSGWLVCKAGGAEAGSRRHDRRRVREEAQDDRVLGVFQLLHRRAAPTQAAAADRSHDDRGADQLRPHDPRGLRGHGPRCVLGGLGAGADEV